jgi:hypothetical protein
MTPDEQWRRIRFPKGELESGAMGRFFIDSLLPAIEDLGQHVDLSTVSKSTIPKVVSTCISRRELLPRSSRLPRTMGRSLVIVQLPKACLSLTATSGRPGSSLRAELTASPRPRERSEGGGNPRLSVNQSPLRMLCDPQRSVASNQLPEG